MITPIKDNQGELHREVQEACHDLLPLSTFESAIEKARNRIEQREAAVFCVSDYLVESSDWNQYLSCVIQVKRQTELLDTKTHTWKIRKDIA